MNMIEVNKLIKNYKDIKALKEVSFGIEEGDIYGYIGPNGSGKTTTIRILCGLIKPNSGNVKILDVDAIENFDLVGYKIGIVMEDHGLYSGLTAFENLEFFARLVFDDAFDRGKQIQKALEMVELCDRKNSLISTYSKGMKRRLAIARALLTNPQILILDEPFDGIDVESRHTLIKILKLWVKTPKRCILMTSHNMDDIEAICTKLAFIKKGKIIAQNAISNFNESSDTEIEILFTSSPNIKLLNNIMENTQNILDFSVDENVLSIKSGNPNIGMELVPKLISNGMDFKEIKNRYEKLEDTYLRLVAENE